MALLGWFVLIVGVVALFVGAIASGIARMIDKEPDETERFLGLDLLKHKKSLLTVVIGVLALLVGRAILLSEGITIIDF